MVCERKNFARPNAESSLFFSKLVTINSSPTDYGGYGSVNRYLSTNQLVAISGPPRRNSGSATKHPSSTYHHKLDRNWEYHMNIHFFGMSSNIIYTS